MRRTLSLKLQLVKNNLSFIAERKLNERAMPDLLRKLVEAHYTKPDILRLAQRYWEDHPDQAQRKWSGFGLFFFSSKFFVPEPVKSTIIMAESVCCVNWL